MKDELLDFAGDYEPAMTFKEIADELGVSPGAVWLVYRSAMRKMRRRRGAFREMLSMAHEAEAMRSHMRLAE